MRDIVILTTGGTIDKVYFDALSDFKVGSSVVDAMLEAGLVRSGYRIQPIMAKDSLEIDDTDRDAIFHAASGAPEDCVVITHGTDTMTMTAKRLLYIKNKTIVLCGALSPARFKRSDANFNFAMAFGAVQVAPVGVWIAMNGVIFPAHQVRKDRTRNAFVAIK